MPAQDVPDLSISKEKLEEINLWLYDQITHTKQDMDPVIDLWQEINKLYEQTELPAKKDFPFEGAAYLMIPIMPTIVEMMKSMLGNTLWAPADPFTPRLTRKDLKDFLKPMRKFMTWATHNELMLPELMESVWLEMLKLGTCVVYCGYEQKDARRFEYDEATGFQEIIERVVDRPDVMHISNGDFLMPLETRRTADARWKAHRVRLDWHEVKRRERAGIYKNVDRIEAWVEKRQTEYEDDREDQTDARPTFMDEWEVWEIWFEYDVKEDGTADKLVWSYHLDSRTALRYQYNWFPAQLDPYEFEVFEEREHKVHGTGIGHIAKPYQLEISTMHNQRLDNHTIANSTIFKRKNDALGPNDITLRMGSSIGVDEMDHLEVLNMGQRFDSGIQDEQHSLGLLYQRVGMQDFTGQQALMDAQATTAIAQIAEAKKRFDATIRRQRKFLGRIMTKCMLLYQKYYPEGKTVPLLGEDAQFTEIALEFPDEWFINGIGIDVTATTSATSKELERQNKLSLFGLVTQYFGQLTSYIMQAENPELPVTVRLALLRIVDGLTTLVEDILEDYDLRYSSDLAISMDEIRAAAEAARASIDGQEVAGVPSEGLANRRALAGGSPAGGGQPDQNGQPAGQGAGIGG